MLRLAFDHPVDRPLRLLAIGAHCDDIEIGCGATILKLIADLPLLEVHWVVFASTPERATEAHESARSFLGDTPNEITVLDYADGFFPDRWADIKRSVEVLSSFEPDLIFTHRREDMHQDHRTLGELTWNTFRNHAILEYEIVKYDGDLGQPNFFVPIEEDLYRRKVRKTLDGFPSQRSKHWFTEDTLMSIGRLRGVESASPTGFSEAFHCRKGVLR